MSNTSFNSDDPRLTAYVLGELTDTDRAAVESQLAGCAESRRVVADLRDTTARLFEALQDEPAPALTDAQRRSIHRAAANRDTTKRQPATAASLPIASRSESSRSRAAVTALLAVVTVSAAVVMVLVGQFETSRTPDDALAALNGVHTERLAMHDFNGQVVGDLQQEHFFEAEQLARGQVELEKIDQLQLMVRPRLVEQQSEGAFPAIAGVPITTAQTGGRHVPAQQSARAEPLNGRQVITTTPLLAASESSSVQGDGSRPLVRRSQLSTVVGNAAITGGSTTPLLAENEATKAPQSKWGYLLRDDVQTVPSTPATNSDSYTFNVPLYEQQSGETTQQSRGASGNGQAPATGLDRQSAQMRFGGWPASPHAGLPLNIVGRDQRGDGAVNGIVDPETFTADLDVPFRQGSFELGILPLGGEPIMSNAMSPQTELLLQALRRGERLHEQKRRLMFGVGVGTESYAPIVENPFVSPLDTPLSTFGLDVDTASYANVRRFLMEEHRWPPADAVRIEELVNSFSYADHQPAGEHPLHVTLEAAACPWQPAHRLVRIGVKGREMYLADRPPTSLVFLIDTSGSMRDDNKLPLVKESLRLLAGEMTENDRIALVTYSSEAGLVLGSTSGQHREAIMAVIDSLEAGGSTNGEAGLKLAYDVASQHFITNGTNRVILCTDGDFNVGESADAPLVRMISEKRDTGVFLSICGFGTGNLKDDKLEQIADHGNGQYHYIDGLRQARRVFLDDLAGMLYTIAKDVKLQVEFNPAQVGAYRLLGYENRALAAQDFNNDRIDAGDLGAGHSVTALYEIVPPGEVSAKPASEMRGVDPLKYQGGANSEQRTANSDETLAASQREARSAGERDSTSNIQNPTSKIEDQPSTINDQPSPELLTVKLRYKPVLNVKPALHEWSWPESNSDKSIKLEFPLVDDADGASPSADLEWAAAVASFGMLLRNSAYRGQSRINGVLELARGAKGDDPTGDRQEFIELVLEAQHLLRKATGTTSPPPPELSSLEARRKASLGGHYQELLDKFEQSADFDRYGRFHDAGRKDASPDGQHPAGYWVYVSPHWYIWGETTPVSKAPPVPER